MLKQLHIENFRTWKSAILDFCSGVNVIVGAPDSGKTNIVRAVNWVLYNRPLGNRMQSDFSEEPVSVTIRFDDTVAVLKKVKDKSVYLYNGKDYRAIDKEVPDVISSGANISELNIQEQLDEPYLICSSPGEVARELNKITHLENIDEWVSNLTTMINSENKVLRLLEIDVKEREQQIDKFGDLEVIDDELKTLEELQRDIQAYDKKIESAEASCREIERQQKILSLLEVPVGAEEKLEELGRDIEQLKKMDVKIRDAGWALNSCNETHERYDTTRTDLLDRLAQYKKFVSTLDKCPFCEFCKTDISKHSLEKLLEEFSV
jgi:chromosome segregation ATPase